MGFRVSRFSGLGVFLVGCARSVGPLQMLLGPPSLLRTTWCRAVSPLPLALHHQTNLSGLMAVHLSPQTLPFMRGFPCWASVSPLFKKIDFSHKSFNWKFRGGQAIEAKKPDFDHPRKEKKEKEKKQSETKRKKKMKKNAG